jgi:preprotein translocase subunit SecF
MQLLKNTNFDFLGKRKLAGIISGSVILLGLASLIMNGGPALGIDFTGGTLAQLQFTETVDVAEIRNLLDEADFERPSIQLFGATDEILIRVSQDEGGPEFAGRLSNAFEGKEFTVRRTEAVGPKIGDELKGKALQAILFALLGILVYITLRFDRFYAMGAVAALAHDVMITLGIFSLLGLEIDLAIIAAFLTIVGYSLNDTIVVFDRIRENTKASKKSEFFAVVNRSINETLGRTIITSLTTFVVVLVLYLLGGEVIKNFSFALIIGVIVGTYSSIYIASPLMALMEARNQAKS